MMHLVLKTTRSQYVSPFDKTENDYVVLKDGHVIDRVMIQPQAPARASMVLDNIRRKSIVAAIPRHATTPRFQAVMAELAACTIIPARD